MSPSAAPARRTDPLSDTQRRAVLLRVAASEHALPDQPRLLEPEEYDEFRAAILEARKGIDRILRRQLGIPESQPPGVYGVDTQRPDCYPHGFCKYINHGMHRALHDSLAKRTAPLTARIADRMAGRTHLLRQAYGIGRNPDGSTLFENYIQMGDTIIDPGMNTYSGQPAPFVVPARENPYQNITNYSQHAEVALPYWQVQLWPMTYFAPRLAALVPTLYTHTDWIRAGGSTGTLAEAVVTGLATTRPLADSAHQLWRRSQRPSDDLIQKVRRQLDQLGDHPLCVPPQTDDPWAETRAAIDTWQTRDFRLSSGMSQRELDIAIARLEETTRVLQHLDAEP